jgi:hypothetical protein
MARTLKATILMISEAPGEVGGPPLRRAIAKYILGDDRDAAAQVIRFKEVPAADFDKPAGALYDDVVAAIRAAEGLS